MSYPPFAWQTFDIELSEPKYENGQKVEGSEAMVTVRHNGRPIHRRAKLLAPTAVAAGRRGAGPRPDRVRGQRLRGSVPEHLVQARGTG